MARDLTRWDPNRFDLFDELRNMRRQMDRFVGGFPLGNRDDELGGLDLPVDVYEKGDEVIVKAALPGVDPKDVDIRVADGILHIRAESKQEQDVEEGDYHRREYRYGRCSRSFRLPPNVDVDNAEASYANGMLRLRFPKSEKANERRIQIEAAGAQPQQRQIQGQGQAQAQGQGQGQGEQQTKTRQTQS